MSYKHFTPAALAVAAALALAAPVALAAPSVALTAFEALGSAAGPGTSVMDGNANGGDFFHFNSDASGNSTFFHTYGTVAGLTSYFGARASGTGTFFVNTSATYTDTYVNTSGSSQLVNFGFQVDQSELSVFGQGDGYADLLLRLSFALDGGPASVVAGEHGRVSTAAGASVCTVDDGDVGVLAGFLSCNAPNSASGNSNSFLVSQVLAPGQSLAVNYLIQSEAAGTLASAGAEFQCSYPPEGGLDVAVRAFVVDEVLVDEPPVNDVEIGGEPGYSGCYSFNALSRSGDPAGFSGFTPAQFSFSASTLPNAVPEPGSWALGALALVAALGARRRRA